MLKGKNVWKSIVETLRKRGLTVATMESCTGGAVADAITSISGASEVLHESLVTYCNAAKIKYGVPTETIENYTVYSKQTAEEMAKAVAKCAESDYGIGITGMLGRIDPCNPVEKLNHVWFAIADSKGVLIEKEIVVPNGSRKSQKNFVLNTLAETFCEVLN